MTYLWLADNPDCLYVNNIFFLFTFSIPIALRTGTTESLLVSFSYCQVKKKDGKSDFGMYKNHQNPSIFLFVSSFSKLFLLLISTKS